MTPLRWIVLAALALTILVPAMPSAAGETSGTRHSLELLVKVTASGLGNILEEVPAHDEQIRVVTKYIKPIRFFPDSSGYFFVYDMNGKCVAHATQPELVGRVLIDMQDPRGQYVIRNFIDVARNGGGFVEYLWNNPKSNSIEDKLGYAMQIPNTKLFIGSGIYFSSLRK